jgi:hypothetical protein
MEDACYLCRRTQVDLDRLNEEIRTRVYLSYFTNTRGQIDDERRKISFLQRLKDEESGDPHFRINARQVFGDPKAYEKLMPWIDTLVEITRARDRPLDDRRTIGELVDELLQEERHLATTLEEGLNRLRTGFATGGKSPFVLEAVTYPFPVEWSVKEFPVGWRSGSPGDREPLQRPSDGSKPAVEVPIHLCSVCRRLLAPP